MKLKGEGLDPRAEVISSIPGSLSRLAPPQDLAAPESELPFLVQLGDDAPIGFYPIRVRTDEGLSNVLLFSVGKFPEVAEAESLSRETAEKGANKNDNGSLATAQKVAPPVTINGTLEGPDQDYYRFSAKAGERLVLEVAARRLGSAIDPVIEVLDRMGRELATNDDAPGLGVDARLEMVFPKTDDYFVLVHDSKYSSQEQNFYRLTIGSYPFATGIFPLGWRRGGTVEVTFYGGNLKAPVKVKPNLAVPAPQEFVPISLPGGASLPFLFRVSDLPEVLEPEKASSGASAAGCLSPCPLPPSTVVNGRISRPGEVDKYQFPVSPGEHWVVQLEAADLGTSPLLARLTVLDANTNKPLVRQAHGSESDEESVTPGMTKQVDPQLSFVVPEKVKKVIVTVEDILGRAGPNYAYRLLARRQPLDFSLEVLTPFVSIPAGGTAILEVGVRRYGYKGPIQLTIPNLPDGIVAEGGNIPAQPSALVAANPAYLTLTAKAGTKPQTFQLSVWGQAVSSETPFRVEAQGLGMTTSVTGSGEEPFTAPWLGPTIPVAVAKPLPMSWEVPVRHFRLPQGGESKITWKLVADPQMKAPFEVRMRGTYPCGATFLRDLHVLPKPREPGHPNQGEYDVVSGINTPAVTFDVVLEAVIREGDNAETVVAAPAITVEIVPLYTLQLPSTTFEIKPGGKLEICGTVKHEPGFTGTIQARPQDLPPHIDCSESTISSGQTDFRLACHADSEAKPGEFEFHLVSVAKLADKGNQDYRAPESIGRVKILP